MATSNEEDQTEIIEGDADEESTAVKSKKHDAGVSDLEKVTDFVEEKEILSQNIADAMKAVSERKATELAEKQERARELAKVKINKEDVDTMVHEMEISHTIAERTLREHNGNVVHALISLTN